MYNSLSPARSRHARFDPGALYDATADGVDRARLRMFRIDRELSGSFVHAADRGMRWAMAGGAETIVGQGARAHRDAVVETTFDRFQRIRYDTSESINSCIAAAASVAPKTAPIAATPNAREASPSSGLAIGIFARSSRTRAGLIPPSAKTGIDETLMAARRPSAPRAIVDALFDNGSKTGPYATKSAPPAEAVTTSPWSWVDTPIRRSGPRSARASRIVNELDGR